jgi:hypothetical protein
MQCHIPIGAGKDLLTSRPLSKTNELRLDPWGRAIIEEQ